MSRWTQRRLDQLIDDMLWGRAIRITHGHIDNIFAPPPGRHLELAGNIEYILGQTLDTRKRPHDGILKAWAEKSYEYTARRAA